MPRRVLQLDEELFVKVMTRAVDEGNAEFVHGHSPRLNTLMMKVQDCLNELKALHYRAAVLEGKHRPLVSLVR